MESSFYEDLAFNWSLYKNMFVQGLLIALTLAIVGVPVVARNQIFKGAAISSASTLGIAIALMIAQYSTVHHHTPDDIHADEWLHSDAFKTLMAVTTAIIASLVVVGRGKTRNSYEARIGWIFLFSTVGANLLVANSPHSLEEIHRVHSSSILGAVQSENVLLTVVALVTVGLFIKTWRTQMLVATDPEMAGAVGIKNSRWQWGYAIWLAVCIGFSIRFSGVIFTFGMLVLPVFVARSICRSMCGVLLVSPVIAVACTLLVFMGELIPGWSTGFPSEQLTIFLVAVLLIPTTLFRRNR